MPSAICLGPCRAIQLRRILESIRLAARRRQKLLMSAQFIASVITCLVAFGVIMMICPYLILLERKVCAWVQDRIGPNRTGLTFGLLPTRFHFWGLGQPLADGLKLLFKEDYTPPGTERRLFLLAPMLIVIPAVLAWAVIPLGGERSPS